MIEPVRIRELQHYLYCPHRWGLIEIDRAWAENYFVARANLLHEHVHENNIISIKGRDRATAVSVWNELPEYMLYGVVDCLDRDDRGLCIVEYKPTQPKGRPFNEDDALQVFAQKLCVDHVFNTVCRAELYYGDTRRRVSLPFDTQAEEYDKRLKAVLSDIRSNIQHGVIPPIRKGQSCGGCSMKDICMPGRKRKARIKERIYRQMEDGI